MADPSTPPLILINAVGLTSRWLPYAPRFQEIARQGWVRPLREVLPAVTCTAQATLLTGKTPQEHGIVANGWLYRDTREVRFWQQSNHLLEARPFYESLVTPAGKKRTVAKLFWWFNQGAQVDFSITPKPHYGCDGRKEFGIASQPGSIAPEVEQALGPFPFPTFWGPAAGSGCSEWIARAAAWTLAHHHPDLTLVYLPHLDYDPQRFGPSGCDMPRIVGELDRAATPLLDAARQQGARVWIVSEYGHVDVRRPIYLNRLLRQAGWLEVRTGPFGEMLDTFTSRAMAVCDHQWAHVYVRDAGDVPRVRERLQSEPGVQGTWVGRERADVGLDHPRSGEIVVASEPDAWFAYPYWLEDRQAPDFARTVDIHRKPGFDPCEMFFDPALAFPKGRVIRKLLAKKLGFRIRMDVIPLDAQLVHGSHGWAAGDPLDRPLLIGDGSEPGPDLAMTDVSALLRQALIPDFC